MVIVEVVNRAGRALERFRVMRDRVSIGRAYDNDVIVTDESIDAHHLLVERNSDDRLTVTDLGSRNGTRLRHQLLDGPRPISSGDELHAGRTRIRVLLPSHPVTEALPVGGLDGTLKQLSRMKAVSTIALFVIVLTAIEIWLQTFTALKWEDLVLGILAVGASSALIAMVFAIVSRISTHDGHFFAQLVVVLLYLIAQSVVISIYEFLVFNFLSSTVAVVFLLVASVVVLSYAASAVLHLATNFRVRERRRIGMGVAVVLVFLSCLPKLLEYSEFHPAPSYTKAMKPPLLRFNNGVNEGDFVNEAMGVFAQSNHDE